MSRPSIVRLGCSVVGVVVIGSGRRRPSPSATGPKAVDIDACRLAALAAASIRSWHRLAKRPRAGGFGPGHAGRASSFPDARRGIGCGQHGSGAPRGRRAARPRSLPRVLGADGVPPSAYSLERVVHASARTPGGFVASGDVDVNSAGPECGDDAAVHEEICSGDECGVGSEEEGGDGWNLVGGADTPGERTGDPPRPPPVGGRSPSLRITPRVHTPHDATTARSSRCRPDPRSRGQSDSHRPSPSCRSVLALVTRMSGSWAKPERLRGALAAGAPLDELCGTSERRMPRGAQFRTR